MLLLWLADLNNSRLMQSTETHTKSQDVILIYICIVRQHCTEDFNIPPCDSVSPKTFGFTAALDTVANKTVQQLSLKIALASTCADVQGKQWKTYICWASQKCYDKPSSTLRNEYLKQLCMQDLQEVPAKGIPFHFRRPLLINIVGEL